MKTLKKTLCLVLALVMVVGTMAVAASADFKDSDSIKYKEAVDVLSGIGVINGKDDGNFAPAEILTREQAAKIIAYMLLGDAAEDLKCEAAPFTDVAASWWSAPYISYCSVKGIVAGTGDGSFNKTGELTGSAFAKMLLVALGYDAEIEGLVGDQWDINVQTLAKKAGIVDGIDGYIASAPVSREAACKMAFNTLNADMVEYYSKGIKITTDDTDVQVGASPAEKTGDLFREVYFPDLAVEEGEDDYGRTANVWTNGSDDIGTYGATPDYVLVAQKDQDFSELLKDNGLDKKVTEYDDFEVECGEIYELWVEDKAITDLVYYYYEPVTVTDVEKIDDEDELYTDFGATVEYALDFDWDTDVEDVIVDKLSESKDGYQAIGTFEKDDILCAIVNEDGKILEIAKAESFNGKVSAKGDNYVKVSGTKYAIISSEGFNFDDTYTFYTDPNGIIIYADVYKEAEADLEYCYLIERASKNVDANLYDEANNSAKVKVMFLDGSVKTLDYDVFKATKGDNKDKFVFKYDGDEYVLDTFNATITEGWYAYTKNSDGKVTLKSAVKADVSGIKTVAIAKDDKTIADGLYATSKTVVTLFNEDGIFKTYKGYANFDTINGKALVVYGDSDDYAKNVYVYDADATEGAETIDVALFVSAGDEIDGGVVCTFYVDGKKVDYTVEKADAQAASAGELYEITIEDDVASIDALDAADYATGTAKIVSDDYVVIGAGEPIDLADGCAVYQVSKDGKTVSAGTLAADKDVVVILNSDGEATQIFIYKDITLFNAD